MASNLERRWPVTRQAITKRANITLTNIEKFVSSGKRKIRGLASSVRPDRVGDIVEPRGGDWALPVPLLWQHSHKDPIGWVRSIDVRADGLWIEAEIAEGFSRSDEVWKMVQAGLIDSFSIGFRGLKSEPLPSGGLRFTKWELLEISVVTVPANPDAKISRDTGAVKLIRSRKNDSVRLIRSRPLLSAYSNEVPGHPGAIPLAKGTKGDFPNHPGAVRVWPDGRKGAVRINRRGR